MLVGEVVAGSFESVVVREKAGARVEVGELLATVGEPRTILQVTGIEYASQLSQQNRELISGLRLEDEAELSFFDRSVRTYNVLRCKLLVEVTDRVRTAKRLPEMFAPLRRIEDADLEPIVESGDLFAGRIRSGSRSLVTELRLSSRDILSHHVLIAAQTGKGKSNLTKCLLVDGLENRSFGLLVLDPHDEYFGRAGPGLKDARSKRLSYYSSQEHPNARPLRFRLAELRPSHFNGVTTFSDAQNEAISYFRRVHKREWIVQLLRASAGNGGGARGPIKEETLQVLRRKLSNLLNIDDDLAPHGIFTNDGSSILAEVCDAVESGDTVIVDTSLYSGAQELLIGSIITTEIFRRFRSHKRAGRVKPQVSIVIEEAPRVLGKAVLAQGSNVFEQVAREGRKFGVGLVAITQVPSLIQREILANMNTKIVLGLEMALERNAIVESAAQDISDLSSAIASLEKGEAIITSSFTRFPMPVAMPRFETLLPEAKPDPRAGQRVRF